MTVDASDGKVELKLPFGNGDWQMGFSPEADGKDWCHVDYDYYYDYTDKGDRVGEVCVITLRIDQNVNLDDRVAVLVFASDTERHILHLTQAAARRIIPEDSIYYVQAEDELLEIKFRTNMDYTYQFEFGRPEWMGVGPIERLKDLVTFHMGVKPNTGFGRRAYLKLYGEEDERILEIRQEPRTLQASEEINGLTGGDLCVKLGRNEENYRNLNTLSLNGSLNDDDLEWLKLLFPRGMNLQHLDLSTCNIYSLEGDCVIPVCCFSNALNLESIELPYTTTHIKDMAFQGCWSLKSIQIPDAVKRIGHQAFANCLGLTEIQFSESSVLQELDDCAFNLIGSTIESLTLPATLTKIANTAFRGLQLKELHVRWGVPPTLDLLDFRNDKCVLYVPTGYGDAYRNADYWKDFAEIYEEDVEE